MARLDLSTAATLIVICVFKLYIVATNSAVVTESLFPTVIPPHVHFTNSFAANKRLKPNQFEIPAQWGRHLVWNSLNEQDTAAKIARLSGFAVTKSGHNWIGTWCRINHAYKKRHKQGPVPAATTCKIRRWYQKVNRLPGLDQLCNKAAQWNNLKAFGPEQLLVGILPTFVLPAEFQPFKSAWQRHLNKLWISKPPDGSRGENIHVIQHWTQARNFTKPTLVQKYVSDPFLIVGKKLELRLLVLVTNVAPLRLYISYNVRTFFAPVNFTLDPASLNDGCVHSRLRPDKCSRHVQLSGVFGADTSALLAAHFTPAESSRLKVDMEDAVVKSFLSIEPGLVGQSLRPNRKRKRNSYNGYQLVSFDFFIDAQKVAWLNEVNCRPGLKLMPASVAATIMPIFSDLFNIVGYHLPPTKSLTRANLTMAFDKRLYEFPELTSSCEQRGREGLTRRQVELLAITEDEFSRSLDTSFKRVFPCPDMAKYMRYLNSSALACHYNVLNDFEGNYGRLSPSQRAGKIQSYFELANNYEYEQTV